MDLALEGRVAIVTGGARGIGREHARMLGSEGAIIVVNDLDADRCDEAVAELKECGVRATAAPGDAADERVAAETIKDTVRSHGRLDLLVNNAGIGVKSAYRVEDMPAEAWETMVHVHMGSTFLWSRAAIEPMRRGGFGRIVNTSSMNYTGGGRPGVAHYAAAKAGIAGFTRTLAKEVGRDGITVNAIAPGYVATGLIAQFTVDMINRLETQNPVGRLCRPDEVAAVVAFLCSQQAAFINGECICIDGGRRDYHWG